MLGPAIRGRATLGALAARPADLLVIGGGITGAGIARDAAMRGLRTVLVERDDLGAGTSSRSSRLIHGGLRYLEQRAWRLVSEANRERRILLTIAPHLVRPLPFVFPLHRGDRISRWQLAAGMWLYDLLAAFRNVARHRMLGKRALLELEPMLRVRGALGGARYFDAQCDDARLVLATARSAIAHGALVANYMAVLSLDTDGDRIIGARVEDRLTGERATLAAAVVVNATGPWTDEIRRMEDPAAPPLLRPTKGVHVVVPRSRVGHRDAVAFLSPVDGRVIFALPWGELSYIGTTDTETGESPEQVRATEEDIVYLLRSLNARFPNARLGTEDVLATWAGLRPLLRMDANGAGNGTGSGPSARSREHAIVVGRGGMLTVAGGKLTTYRKMAAEVVDRAVRELRQRGVAPPLIRARTDEEPLPGGEAHDFRLFRERALELGLPPATADHLVQHYGTEAAGIVNLAASRRELQHPLHPEHPAIEAEVIHTARRELAQSVADVLVRRIHLYYETRDHGLAAARTTAERLGEELGWDADTIARETRRYAELVAAGG
jgi:glycerol-3-phosphate dehydrogenase